MMSSSAIQSILDEMFQVCDQATTQAKDDAEIARLVVAFREFRCPQCNAIALAPGFVTLACARCATYLIERDEP